MKMIAVKLVDGHKAQVRKVFWDKSGANNVGDPKTPYVMIAAQAHRQGF